jgi:hypothetical protein
MIRRFVLLIFLTSLIVNAGCSRGYESVVINNSSGTIEVKYRLQPYTPEARGKYLIDNAPATLTLEDFEKAKYEWRKLRRDEYEFDDITGTLSVSLAPAEVLWVDHTTDAGVNDGQFHLASIRISGVNGSIELEGRQAQAQFQIESDNKYVLRYK